MTSKADQVVADEEEEDKDDDTREATNKNEYGDGPEMISYKKSAQERAGVKFPISRLAKFAKNGRYADRIGQGAPVFMAGVLEYLTFEILELASSKAEEDKSSSNKKSIMPRHIMMAIKADEEFNKFLKGAEFKETGRAPTYFSDIQTNKKKKNLDESESDEEIHDMPMDSD